MRWVTSDLHMFHKNILKFTSRGHKDLTFMHQAMVLDWNLKVAQEDEVFILGDVSFGKAQETSELLYNLRGKKYLVRGNHDQICDKVAQHFEWIKDYHETTVNKHKVVMFHYPINAWKNMEHGSVHLHGHLHTEGVQRLQARRFDVGVDGNPCGWLYNLDSLTTKIITQAPARVRKDNIALPDNYIDKV